MSDPDTPLDKNSNSEKKFFISTICPLIKTIFVENCFLWLGLIAVFFYTDPLVEYFQLSKGQSLTWIIAFTFTIIYFLLKSPTIISMISSYAEFFIGPVIILIGATIFLKLFTTAEDYSIVWIITLGYIALHIAFYKKSNRRAISLIVGYLFVLGTFIVIGYLAINGLSKQNEVSDSSGREYNKSLLQLLPGCDFSQSFIELNEKGDKQGLNRDERADIPSSAKYCGRLPPQWSVSIGGLVLDCYVNGQCPWQLKNRKSQSSDDVNEQDDYEDIKKLAQKEKEQAFNSYNQAKEILQRAELDNASNIEQLRNIVFEKESKLFAAVSSLKSAEHELKSHREKIKKAVIQKHNFPDSRLVVGGIVIPVYFFILAMAGGLVSMARKLPEFQARSNKEYTEDYSEKRFHTYDQRPPIHQSQVSEYVIFQMLQVVTTLPIAVVAYAYIRPENMASNILLGFAAGYSSEIFLMAVRKFSDALVAQKPESILAMTQEKVVKLEKENETLKVKHSDNGLGLNVEGKLYQLGDALELREKVEDQAEGTVVLLYQFAAGESEITVQVANNLKRLKVSKAQLRPLSPQELAFEVADEGLV
ncbi:hypothetical protein [Pseudoteredinibacter isoporae]|uniref:Uncharacterized protein n=1 Tax=Pseudoteredinibacter isoporae TaxID=570281 RepID=A0A7X0JSK7_9GAMM|nr:hypothetical protein [Pseudoteredinibacter isoporae]MBB6521499.1 hypothetical protein [Pseudoteredinibacter isoporae]NHO87053.1 hypothetical protein [Pseudoteredinibacter isoporae]NIB22800.1 hypothetical protein [Pseudoteredinibacter isoporae]